MSSYDAKDELWKAVVCAIGWQHINSRYGFAPGSNRQEHIPHYDSCINAANSLIAKDWHLSIEINDGIICGHLLGYPHIVLSIKNYKSISAALATLICRIYLMTKGTQNDKHSCRETKMAAYIYEWVTEHQGET